MSALAEALLAAQSELPTAIPRDAQGQGYRYLTLDALIAATRPILNRHGLTITQWPNFITCTGGSGLAPALTTVIEWNGRGDDPDESNAYGNRMEYTMPLYLSEPKNMQALGAAITYARRYAWASALGIAAEEDTDAAPRDESDVPF